MNPRIAIALALLFQLGALGAMLGARALLMRQGQEIRLNAVSSGWSGQGIAGYYLNLRFPISERAREDSPGRDLLETPGRIYALLRKEGDGWTIASLHRTPPTAGPDHVVLRARATGNGRLLYGIERYYVSESRRSLLRKRLQESDGAVSVLAAVSRRSGRMAIKRIVQDGETLYQDPLF